MCLSYITTLDLLKINVSMRGCRILTLVLIRVIRVICYQLGVARSLVVFFGHEDDPVLTLSKNEKSATMTVNVVCLPGFPYRRDKS